ncbi:hypothetical protein VM1G_09426 [Cytospora mali]|uniref:Uncharacterized protein n=1 Tax=Cytospora mali TaxID=578113 RepID=A0A194WCJ2_CYTMA|nr:hypothetical protein VM1G_09426 [Valsa mali]
MDSFEASPGNQLPPTLCSRALTELIANKVTDKILSLLIVTDEIRASACREIVAEITEDIKQNKHHSTEAAQQAQQAQATKSTELHHRKSLVQEAEATKMAGTIQRFWSPDHSEDPFVRMSAAEWKRLGDVFL